MPRVSGMGGTAAAGVVLAVLRVATAAAQVPVVLYDGSTGNTVQAQGWFAYVNPGNAATVGAGNGGTNLSTIAAQDMKAGWFSHVGLAPIPPFKVNANFPNLNAATGYTLRVDVQVAAEAHTGEDRAGLSITAISGNQRGIELAFWTGQVWAQNGGVAPVLFTHGESAMLDTSAAVRRYDLVVHGGTYELFADGVGPARLSGSLRDYTAFDATGLPFNPYTTAGFVFVGDNTSRGAAAVLVRRIEFVGVAQTFPPVAGPCAADVCGVGGPPSPPDGSVTGDDFIAFVNVFAAGDGLADITGIGGPPALPDGLVTGDDFNAFIGAFAAGCL